MIYSNGAGVEVISSIGRDGSVRVKRIVDGMELDVPVLTLVADKGLLEIEQAAYNYAYKELRGGL